MAYIFIDKNLHSLWLYMRHRNSSPIDFKFPGLKQSHGGHKLFTWWLIIPNMDPIAGNRKFTAIIL